MDGLNYRFDRDTSGQIKHRWGAVPKEEEEEGSLLAKKDLQIKRLQSELENERKRADNALKLLDSFRNSHRIEEEASSNAKTEITRRLKAEEEARKLRAQNEMLRALLMQQVGAMQGLQKQITSISNQ